MSAPTDQVPGATSGQVTTGDGVTLRYLEAGTGPDLLLVHGWSQTAAQWRKQIEQFAGTHHVVAIDLRGHGRSDKPGHGYRVARLATDLHETVIQLGLSDVTVMGHSMGCSVTWSYWDHFGGDRIGRLVLVDETAAVVNDPSWPAGRAEKIGAGFDPATVTAILTGLRTPEAAEEATRGLISTMVTPAMPPAELEWMVARNLDLPREHAATLLADHLAQDWSDVLARITVPTLVIGGAVSIFPAAGLEWVASQIPGAQVRIFSEAERGSHFMFWENDALFAQVVREFLEGATA